VTWFVLEMRYVDAERRQQNRERHLEYLRGLAAEGVLVAAGPWTEGLGSLTVYDVPSVERARELVEADPYLTNGVTEILTLREWNPVVRRDA